MKKFNCKYSSINNTLLRIGVLLLLLIFGTFDTQAQSCTLSNNSNSCQGVSNVAIWLQEVPGYTGSQTIGSNGINMSISGGSFSENIAAGTATMGGTVTQGDLSYTLSINLSGRTTSGSPGHSSGCAGYTVSSYADWYYYANSGGTLTCTSGNASNITLTQKGGPYEIGTGANLWTASAYGGAGWFYINGGKQCDFGPVISCPNPCTATLTASNTGPYCDGGTVQLSATVGSATGTVTYKWTGPGGFTSTLPNPTSSNGAGTYTVTITYANGKCTKSASTTVVINTNPTVAVASVTQPTCTVATGTITITSPTGTGLSYSLNGGTYQTSTTFANKSPGTYTLKVKNSGGCLSPVTNVTINPQPTPPVAPIATVVQPTCPTSTGSITITSPIGSGITYSINGGTYQASTTFSGVAPGTYSVTSKNTEGCISSVLSVTLNIPPDAPVTPTASTTQPTCTVATGTITITAPTDPGITYSIDGTSYTSTMVYSGLTPGTYSVRTKGTTGCVSNPKVVIINPQPITPVTPTVTSISPTCAAPTGGSITVTAPTGSGYTYSKDGGVSYQGGTTFSGLGAGTYIIKVKSPAGCESATGTSVTLSPPTGAPPTPTATLTNPTCAALTSGKIVITSPTGAGYTYSKNGGTYQASTTFSSLTKGTYTITVKNASGCTTSTQFVLTTPGAVEPTFVVEQPACGQGSGTVTVTNPLPGAGILYNFVAFDSTPNISGYNVGTAVEGEGLTLLVSVNGCWSNAYWIPIDYSTTPPPAPTLGVTQPTCATPTGTITVTAPFEPSNIGYYTYSIDGVNFQNSPTFTGLAPGNYTVTVKDGYGCKATSTTTINPAPVIPTTPVAVATQPTCAVATGTITISAPTGANITYSIDGSNYANTSGIFTAVVSGTYSVSAKSSTSSCVSITPASVTIDPMPVVPTIPTTTITQPNCATETGTITVTNPIGADISYSINGVIFQASPIFSNLAPATYSIVAQNNISGCVSNPTSATINPQPNVPNAPFLSVVQPSCSVATGSINISDPSGPTITYSIDGINYTNTTGDFTGLTAGTYSVTVKDISGGCISSPVSVTIITQPVAPVQPTVILTQPTCAMPTGTITVTAPTGANIAYNLDGTAGYMSNTTGIFSGLPAGSYIINAMNLVGNCASSDLSITLNAAIGCNCTTLSGLVATATPSSIATGGSSALNVTGTGITAGTTTFSWAGTGGFTSIIQAPSTGTINTAGGYSYSITATNANGTGVCTATATTSVNVTAAPVACTALSNVIASATPSSMTTGNASALTVTGTGIVAGTTTFSWTGTGGFSSAIQAPSTGVLASAGGYSYTVTATNADGTGVCTATATTSFTVTPACTPPTGISAGISQVTCTAGLANADGKITLSGFTTEKYDLFAGDPYAGTATFATATTIPAGGVIVSNLANPAVSQVYTIRVFNGNNCYTDLKVTLNNKNCSCPVMCQPVITRKTKG